MKIRVLCLDFDGVVANSTHQVYESVIAVCRHFGIAEESFEKFYETFSQPYMNYYRKLGLPETVKDNEVSEIFFQHMFGLSVPVCMDGVGELVRNVHARGIPLVIVSAHVKREIELWLKSTELDGYFEEVHGLAENKVAILCQIASQHKCRNSEVAFVGDLPSDMEDSKVAGVVGIGFAMTEKRGAILTHAGAKYVFARLEDIANVI